VAGTKAAGQAEENRSVVRSGVASVEKAQCVGYEENQ
jgi:hypothetical protein